MDIDKSVFLDDEGDELADSPEENEGGEDVDAPTDGDDEDDTDL